MGQCLPPSPLLVRAESRAWDATGKQCQGSGLRGFNFPLAFKCIHICVCICLLGTSFADTGEGSCAGRQELKGLEEKAGWGVLLGDGDSSVWQSGVFIFGADRTKWYLTVRQGRNLLSLLAFISE